MTNQIGDILSTRKILQPDEIEQVKNFVQEQFQSEVKVATSPKTITITVPNSALAGSLRMELFNLQTAIKTDKNIHIRIG